MSELDSLSPGAARVLIRMIHEDAELAAGLSRAMDALQRVYVASLPPAERKRWRRRAAYQRRVCRPGSPRSKRWRAGTRRTKRLARRTHG